jgi:ubiquinone/menaquinone biosynthesis C-methylase UbiE
VGAGSGYLTEHLAQAVGPDGRVYAVDISERSLSQLRLVLAATAVAVTLIPAVRATRVDPVDTLTAE